ncbi:MAG: methyltransferase domain-containing protein [Phycisphaeraceae bacterium]|nr:methyltransferase domain-containing protein [Phycisphaeraceae bacterium]
MKPSGQRSTQPKTMAQRPAPTRSITDRLSDVSELVRLRVLRILEQEELSVGEIAQIVQLPQSTVSRHLKILADGQWLLRRAAGTATLYRLILDDLPAESRSLWLAIRDQLPESGDLAEDARRLRAVLAQRDADPQAFFGRVVGEWDRIRSDWFGDRFTPAALLSLIPSGWTVADLGCGTGNAAELLAPNVKRVHAVDQSLPMLTAAKKRLSGFSNVSFHQGTLEHIPLDDGSVDAIVSVLVLHHVPEPLDALREMRRILRGDHASGTGGVALIVDMLDHDRTEYRHTMAHKHLGFAPKAMHKLCKDAGFASTVVRPLASEPDAKGPGLFVAVARVSPD